MVQPDPPHTLTQAVQCFCLPSRGEGFGLVYLEAMRAEKPVLTSRQEAGAELIVDGVTGRAVDPMNTEQLLQGILEITAPRAEAMGRAGCQRFQEQYCYERFLHRFMQQVTSVYDKAGVQIP